MLKQYVLDLDDRPIPIDDLLVWGAWMETANRQAALDRFGDVRVSTVFLGLDHQYGDGPPLLWETMVFGSPLDGDTRRYSTKAGALAGHAEMCAAVALALANP